MTSPAMHHEKLFDEICNKLNELSSPRPSQDEVFIETKIEDSMSGNREQGGLVEEIKPQKASVELVQQNLKKVQGEINGMQEELREKIRNLETVSYPTSALSEQVQILSEQLQIERANNTKLSTDLAKSLELSLQLQLELQGVKARANQVQMEEKKYSQSLMDRIKALQKDLELNEAMKQEVQDQLAQAKKVISERDLENQSLEDEKSNIAAILDKLKEDVLQKDQEIVGLNQEMDKLVHSFTELEGSARSQSEALKNLMTIAENKIVEIKVALDKKTVEAQDYYNHLQQSLTQMSILKQENSALKDYMERINQFQPSA